MTPCEPLPADSAPTLDLDGCVATLRLQRPSRRNSLTDTDLEVMLDHLARVDADPGVRVLVLDADTRGQPRPVFSAGYDVGGFDAGAPRQDTHHFERVPQALAALRPVTVCAMRGSVYGGATDLVLACDLRLALAGTEWRMPAAALGLHYYASGLRRYVASLGLDLAKRAFLTARPLPVETLAAAGVFEQVLPAEAYDAALQALVQAVAALAPLAAQATKQSLNELAQGQADEVRLQQRERLSMASADFAEGRAAFAERRKPRFEGC
jgi:enoyl-CoA hydratase/carnithine racemase